MCLNDLEYFTNVITTGWSTAKQEKKVLSDPHCAKESMDNEQQAGTETQGREKPEAGERETIQQKGQKCRQEEVVKLRGSRRNKTRQRMGDKREVPNKLY